MYHHAFVVLGVIVLAFIGAKKFKLNTELTLFVSAVAALLAHLVTLRTALHRDYPPFRGRHLYLLRCLYDLPVRNLLYDTV